MTSQGLEELVNARDATVDIVFVHGLLGNSRHTWTKNNVLWPRDLLPADIRNARIFTFGYSTNDAHPDSNEITRSRMEHHAAKLCADLVSRRGSEMTDRPIILVAHCLGGLVCAQAIVMGDRAARGENIEVIARLTRGIIFLGTPFHCTSVAAWADHFKTIFAHGGLKKSGYAGLKTKSDTSWFLGDEFSAVLRKRDPSDNPEERIGVVFLLEELPISGVMIVDEHCGSIPGRGEKNRIHADHQNICRFDQKQDPGYKVILAAIKRMMVIADPKKEPPRSSTVTFNNYDKVINQSHGDFHIGSQSFTF